MSGVVVLDYGSGNLRSAERALARVGADVTVTVRPGRRRRRRRAGGARRRRVRGLHGRDRGARRRSGDRGPGRGRPAGARHLRRHADPVRVRRRARRGDQGAGAAARRGDPAGRRRVPHMGWNTVGAPAGSVLFAGLPAGRPVLLRPLLRGPTRATLPDAPAAAVTTAVHGGAFVAAVEPGRWRPPSSTRRSPARRRLPRCCATGSRHAVTRPIAGRRRAVGRRGRASR